MRRSAATSPFYPAWVESHSGDLAAAKGALERRSLDELGPLVERSTFKMHACMWASQPPLRYLRAESLALLDLAERLRQEGTSVWATMDAGPHVKLLCAAAEAERIHARVCESGHCVAAQILRPGPGLQLSLVEEGGDEKGRGRERRG